ncbi:MAG: type VI secretion system tube protein Hcp [Planctomycetia bacterium]|nr:type VI secretion system tube protein Hcp [Planctomycetia bacterium]
MPSFVQFPEIPSWADDPQRGWIPVKSISQNVTLEITKFEKGRARQTNRAEVNELEFKKIFDRSSMFLYAFVSEGHLLSAVNFAFTREDEKEVYLKCELKNVYIAEHGVEVDDGSDPEESFKLNFESIDWKFRPKNKAGKLGDWLHVAFNRQDHSVTTRPG